MKKIVMALFFVSSLSLMAGELANAGADIAGEGAATLKQKFEDVTGAGFAKQQAEEREKDKHPWTASSRSGYCRFKGTTDQYFPDCDELSPSEMKVCCYNKTKSDLSTTAQAAAFEKLMKSDFFAN